MRGDGSRCGQHLAPADFVPLDPPQQAAHVIAGHPFFQGLVEHFYAGAGGFPGFVGQPDDLHLVAHLDPAAFDTSGNHRPTTFDGEDVLDGHQERLVHVALRLGNVLIQGVHQLLDALAGFGVFGIFVGGFGRAVDNRRVVPVELVLVQQVAHFHFDQFQQVRVVDQVHFVEEHDDGRHAHLSGQQDVFAGLGHRSVGCRNDQDGPVHLGRPGDHVLDEVGMARAVDVGVVAFFGFVFHVGDVDGHGLGFVADRAPLGNVVIALELSQTLLGLHRQDGPGQGGLAVVDVPDGAHVHVGLGPLKYFLGHARYLSCGKGNGEQPVRR